MTAGCGACSGCGRSWSGGGNSFGSADWRACGGGVAIRARARMRAERAASFGERSGGVRRQRCLGSLTAPQRHGEECTGRWFAGRRRVVLFVGRAFQLEPPVAKYWPPFARGREESRWGAVGLIFGFGGDSGADFCHGAGVVVQNGVLVVRGFDIVCRGTIMLSTVPAAGVLGDPVHCRCCKKPYRCI